MRLSAAVKRRRQGHCMQTNYLQKRTLPIDSLLWHDERTSCGKGMRSQTGQERSFGTLNPHFPYGPINCCGLMLLLH